jgi:hypothetical protein
MAGTLQADHQQVRQRIALSDISDDLGLSNGVVSELRNIGIRSADDLLGLIYSAFEDLASELNISPPDLYRIGLRLRRYVDPYTLQEMEDIYRSNSPFSTGAELGAAPITDNIPDYEEE